MKEITHQAGLGALARATLRTGTAHAAVAIVLTLVSIGVARAEKPVDAMTSCWRNTALAAAAANCDPPEAVVDATYRACLPQEVNWHNLLIRAGGPFGQTMANTFYMRVKQSTRPVLLSLVNKARVEKGLCK